MDFTVVKKFKDKLTKRIRIAGSVFSCDDSERIADLQGRGLIGEEIPQEPLVPPADTPPAGESEKEPTVIVPDPEPEVSEEKVNKRANSTRRKDVPEDRPE